MAPPGWCWMKSDSWSNTATWICSGLLLAAGLTSCVLYTIATHHFFWATMLTLTLFIVIGIPVYLCLFAGYRSLQLFAGSLYIPASLWVVLWSLPSEAQGYIRRGLLTTGAFLFLLGILFLYLFFAKGKVAEEDEDAMAGEGEASP
jgi:hypothetical protein